MSNKISYLVYGGMGGKSKLYMFESQKKKREYDKLNNSLEKYTESLRDNLLARYAVEIINDEQ